MIKRGYTFTHQSFIDPTWKPQAGQRYGTDAPKATMIVTRVTATGVHYKYASAVPDERMNGWVMERDRFLKRYGPEAEAEKLRQELAADGVTMPDWRPMS
jgi:hypothetical protein